MGTVAKAVPGPSPELPGPGLGVDAAHGLAVREVLALPALAGARVVAGARGLDRVVARLNVMEVPDILPWVKPHELLLTTGYPLRGAPDRLADLVADLDDRGLAAVAVKLHRYLDRLPTPALVAADRRGLPLIELPDGVAFDDVLNQVLGQVLDRQGALLRRSEEVHRALVNVVLAGGGLQELAGEMAAVLDGPVLVTTADGRVVAEDGPAADLARVRACACFDPSGRFRVERESRGVHGHPDLAGNHAVVPVVAGSVDHGRLVAFSGRRPLDRGDVHVLERAATVAALAVTKALAVTAVEGKYRGDFLRDVLAGRAGPPERLVAHCASLGWSVDRPLVVVVAELDTDPGQRPVQERFTAAWQSVVRSRDPRAPVVGFHREVVALLAVPPGSDPDRVVRPVVREVSGDGGGGRRSFATGVSRVVTDPQRLPEAYEQARRAVQVGRQLRGSGAVAHFDELGVFRLLTLVPDPAELGSFAAEVLGGLADRADPEAADLRRTLQVLLDENLNVAAAARRLHFHYNTLRYRIAKLERLLGPFTGDPHLRLDLAVALKVLQLQHLP